MQELETRHFRMELRVEGDDADPTLVGHIAVFNKLSDDLGGFREQIAPGAFAETIKRDDIRCLWNHENDLLLGRIKSGTLELSEDKVGLAFKNKPPQTSWFRDRLVSLKRKDVTGASFGFFTESDEWDHDKKPQIRTLKKVRLVEVSPGVTFPAYSQTSVAIRSMERSLTRRRGRPDVARKWRRLRLLELLALGPRRGRVASRTSDYRDLRHLDLRRRKLRLMRLSAS